MLFPAKVSRTIPCFHSGFCRQSPVTPAGGGGRRWGEGMVARGKRGGYYRFPTNVRCPFVNVLRLGTEPKPVMDDRPSSRSALIDGRLLLESPS
ncbi:hypothetical protein QUB60_00155 [Microcoleus sp. A2-C5]|uniref:hypothetical protein n=1 Tax=unclassified Microcoleus TaxID=2642155 RepID=UPI002FCF9107